MKLADISGRKKKYLKPKIDELETNRRIKISATCIWASMTSRRVTCLELIECRMRRTIWLQTRAVFWLGGANISLSYSTCMGLLILGRQKYIQQNL